MGTSVVFDKAEMNLAGIRYDLNRRSESPSISVTSPMLCSARARRRATDATIEQVGRLTEMEVLHLTYTSLGDTGLVHLKGLGKLSSLFLGVTEVTDDGLRRGD